MSSLNCSYIDTHGMVLLRMVRKYDLLFNYLIIYIDKNIDIVYRLFNIDIDI